jgi:hypothetical protein
MTRAQSSGSVSVRRRRVICVALLSAFAVVASLWWKHGENERQLRSLAEQVYEYAGYGDELPDGGSYRRDLFGIEYCQPFDDWVGAYGVGIGGERERTSGAEPIAAALEAEEWTVDRWKTEGGGGDQALEIFARRGRVRLHILFGSQDIRIGAFDGPCGSLVDPAAPPDWTNPIQVEHFDP